MRVLTRVAVALSLGLFASACSATRVQVQTNSPQVRELFVIAGDSNVLAPYFSEGRSQGLGDYVASGATGSVDAGPKGAIDFARFELVGATASSLEWQTVRRPVERWLSYSVASRGDELVLKMKKSALKKHPDLALGLVTLTESGDAGPRYFGSIIDTRQLEPGGFWFISRGPKIEMRLPPDGPPVRVTDR